MCLTSWIALATLLVSAVILLVGELLGSSDLHIITNHISEFAARPNLSGRLVNLSMWGFALSYFTVAVHLLYTRTKPSLRVALGCLGLSAAASLLPFVAEYRLYYHQPEPPAQLSVWQRLGLVPRPIQPQKGAADVVREGVHGNVITASMLWAAGALTLLGFGCFRRADAHFMLRHSWAVALFSLLLFWMCNLPPAAWIKGLLELSAFSLIAGWLWLAVRHQTM